MTTAAATREPPPGASNSANLQKMLDLEHKLKMERLHPLPVNETPKRRPVTMQPPPRPAVPLQARRKDPHSRGGSLTMNPATIKLSEDSDLHIRVPTPPWRISKSQKLEPMPHSRAVHPQKTVTFVADATADEDKKSETSSICHSPSWEGYGQRKKEKKAEEKQRRKDKEQAEKDARDAKRKSASRLIKKPPSASRTNMILNVRSTSTPELLDQANSRRSSMQSDHSQLPPPPKHGRSRSSSVASQIRAALTGYLGGKDEKEKETGFVGGLKLEMERESILQLGTSSKSSEVIRPPPGPRKAHSYGPGSVLPSNPSPPTLPRVMTDGATPGTALRHKGAPPISMRASSRSETLISPTAPPIPGLDSIEKWRTATSSTGGVEASDLAHQASESDAEDGARGRLSGSYVQHHRQLSQERALSGFREDAKVSVKSRYPPQAHRRHQGRNFSDSPDNSSPTSSAFGFRKNSSSGSRSSSTDRGRFLDSLGSFGQPYHAPALDLTTPENDAGKASQERSRSKDKVGGASRGFKGAMQAAFQKVRSSSKPPAASASYFERHPRDAMTTPDSLAMSRPPSILDIEKDPAWALTFADLKPPAIKDPNSTQLSSASSSLYEESIRSPALTNTPDSSRPQSDRGLPPVVGEVGKGKAETLLVTNDERVFRLSHRATVADSTPAGPSPITPKGTFALDRPDSKASLTRDNSQGHIHPLFRKPRPAAIKVDLDADSYRSCLTPLDVEGSKSSLVPLPLEVTPVSSPKARPHSAEEAPAKSLADEQESAETDTSLVRAPSLTKSKSTPNVTADSGYRLDYNQKPLTPPQRSPARDKHAFQSSVSLPDALNTSASPAAQSPRSPNPATYLEEARKAAPSATLPRPLRPPRASGARKESGVDPIAKMFVECCHCKFFHDMPSRVYECMAHPDAMVEDTKLGVSGAISTVVNCPWCKHGMSTQCCAGYAAVVYLKERLH